MKELVMSEWNETHGIETARFLSDNITRTGLNVSISKDGYVFSFEFRYGIDNYPVTHACNITMHEVINKWNGSLRDAIIQAEYVGFVEFKKKLQQYLLFEEDENDIVESNRINRIKNE